MELLLDNLRNVILKKGKQPGEKSSVILGAKLAIQIAIIGGLSLLLGRVAFCYSLVPCALAWMTVLIAKSKAHIYALPLVLLGMGFGYMAGVLYPVEMVVPVVSTILFLLPGAKKLNLLYRALVSGLTLVSLKAAYFLWTGLFYLYDGFSVAMDFLLLFVFTYVLNSFLKILYQGPREAGQNATEVLAVLSTVIMLAVAGLGLPTIGTVTSLHVAALLLTLLFGHLTGPLEGTLAGVVTGIFIMLAASGTPALGGILGCCGMLAGLFKEQIRAVAGVCFAGLALTFGLMKGFPGLYFSIYEPILAALIFILIPQPAMAAMGRFLSAIRQDDRYYEMAGRKQVIEQLSDYQKVFRKLAICSNVAGDYHPARNIVSQQFKGMAKALETMGEAMAWKPAPLIVRKPAFEISVGLSGYAREGKVSGDSYLCTPLREGEYLIVLSDGMGKGVRASEESTLTVNTLHDLLKVGFETETALRMINSILLLKSPDEVFSTVDMVSLNLYTGKARFYKIGAAASFIRRGDEVKSIKVSALPMGIIDQIPVESVSFSLRKGDQLIIVSDGITDAERGPESTEWLETVIREIRSTDPQTMADLIINRAVQRYGLRDKDDMTVITAVLK